MPDVEDGEHVEFLSNRDVVPLLEHLASVSPFRDYLNSVFGVPERSNPVRQPMFVPRFVFTYVEGRRSNANVLFAEVNDFRMYSMRRVLRDKAPLLLNYLVDPHANGTPLRYLPLGLVAALTEREFVSYMGSTEQYGVVSDLMETHNVNRTHLNGRVLFGSMAPFRRLNPSQWGKTQLKVEMLSNKMDMQYSMLFDRYPQLTRLSRILSTLHVDLTNPGAVSWYECDPYEERYEWAKKYTSRWGKFLKMLRHKFGFRYSDAEIDEVANWVGDNLKMPNYNFKVSDYVVDAYREAHFGSCMHDSDAVRFYDEQDNVQVLRVSDEYGGMVARALIWHGQDKHGKPTTILDRIYPSDGGPHIRAAQKYAQDKGWIYKLEQTIGGPLSNQGPFYVDLKDTGDYPYMDTFAFAPEMPDRHGNFRLTNNDYNFVGEPWQNTDNYSPFEDDGAECPYCGNRVDEDDMLQDPSTGRYMCEECHTDRFVYSDAEMEYINRDDAVQVANARYGWSTAVPEYADYIVYSECDDVYYLTEQVGDTRIDDEVVQLTGGEWEDDWTIESNTEVIYDCIIHMDDPRREFYVVSENERQALFDKED